MTRVRRGLGLCVSATILAVVLPQEPMHPS